MAYRLYILMRVDLPSMNPGKAMAQAAHAANLMVHQHGKDAGVKAWLKEGGGFGTTITLAVTKEQLQLISERAFLRKVKFGKVVDTTYPYVVNKEIYSLIHTIFHSSDPIFKDNGQVVLFRKEITCGYIFLAEDDPIKDELVGDLSLHP